MSDPAKLAEKAAQALNSQQYKQAISLYTEALAGAPTAVDYYIKRSTAYQRDTQYERAIADAEIAVKLGHERGKRETIGQAQLRRGISCYLLERYGDAGFCFNLAKKFLADKEKSVEMWITKLDMMLKDQEKIPEDDVRREVSIKEIPDVVIPKKKEEAKKAEEDKPKEEVASKTVTPAPMQPSPPKGVITPRDKIRHEWFQTSTHVVFTLYVKGVPKDDATIDIQERSISIAFPLPNSSEFTYDLDPLFAPIDPKTSTFSILSTKIELKLTKATPGQRWATLEGVLEPKGKNKEETATSPTPAPTLTPSAQPPAYPTSSKKGPKNWDKVAQELSRNPDAAGNPNMDDDEEGDPVNHFFKKLYKDADPDTRRAMMKSYIESNGTALSTNWDEVSKAKVETSPPEGMVAKKWEE